VGKLKLRTGDLSEAAEALRWGRETGTEAGAKTSSLCKSMYDWRKFLISSCRERPMLSRRSVALTGRRGVCCWEALVEIERWGGCPMVVFEAAFAFLLTGAKPPLG
jgi:hypothetical protein